MSQSRPVWFEWCALCVDDDHLCLDCGAGVVHGIAFCGNCDCGDCDPAGTRG